MYLLERHEPQATDTSKRAGCYWLPTPASRKWEIELRTLSTCPLIQLCLPRREFYMINPHIGVDLDEYLEQNERLLHSVANRFHKRLQGTSFGHDDLVSLAAIGFIKAYRNFNPTEYKNEKGDGVKFSTYAVPAMKGEIQRFLRDFNPGARWPRSIKELSYKIARSEIENEEPATILRILTEQEDAMHNQREANLKDIEIALEYMRTKLPRSTEETVFADDGNDISLGETLSVSSYDDDFMVYFRDYLSTLKPKMRKAVELKMKDMTQEEVASMLGVTQVQVSRILKKAGKMYDVYLEEKNTTQGPQKTPIEKSMDEVVATMEKEEEEMKAGDSATAIQLLKQTDLSYREISRLTGCSLSKVADLAKEHRPEEAREAKRTSPYAHEFSGTHRSIQVRNEREAKAIDLLIDTDKTYREIADEVGVAYPRVAYLGPLCRSEERRQKLKVQAGKRGYQKQQEVGKKPAAPGEYIGNRDRAVEMIAQGHKYSDIVARTGVPMGSLTKLRQLYEAGKYQWENPSAKTINIGKEESEMPTEKEEVIVATATKGSEENVEAKAPLEENEVESKAPVVKETEQVEVEKVAEFIAEPKAERKVRRSFHVETEGSDVPAGEAEDEIRALFNMARNLGTEAKVSFHVKINS